MLRKLIKHELRATSRIMLPLFLLSLVTAVGANVATRKLLESESAFVNVIGMILLTAFVLTIAAVCIVAFALMIQRFYKNLLQDEGYVMMTLPVSVHQHIWSKLTVSLIWFVAAGLVVMASMLILLFDIKLVAQFFDGFAMVWDDIVAAVKAEGTFNVLILGAELLVLLVAGMLLSCLQFYAPLSIGHSFAGRKMLMSVLFFFGIGFGMQLVNALVASAADATGLADLFFQFRGMSSAHALMLVLIGYVLAVGTAYYFITAHFLKKRLNLE